MKIAAVLSALAVASIAFAQAPPQPTPGAIEPRPQDVASEGDIIQALYDVISGGKGQLRDWNRMRSLFVPNARLGAAVRLKNGSIRYFGFNVEGYISNADPYMKKTGFFEREIHRHDDTFGNISQVFSTYESRYTPEDPKPFERGINSIQLMNDGKRWWVVSIYWQAEDNQLPLPAQWLGG